MSISANTPFWWYTHPDYRKKGSEWNLWQTTEAVGIKLHNVFNWYDNIHMT